MRRKPSHIILIFVIGFALIFLISVIGFIKSFRNYSDVQVFDKNSLLNKDSLHVFDLTYKRDTVILFQGVQVLNFWASWCNPCLEEMPDLHKLQHDYPDLRVSLLSFDDSISLYRIIKEKNITLPVYLLKDTLIFQIPEVLPRTIILQNNKVVRDMYVSRDWYLPEYTTMFDSLTKK